MLSSALTNLNATGISDCETGSSSSSVAETAMKKLSELIKSSQLGCPQASASKLFSIDSILRSSKKRKAEATANSSGSSFTDTDDRDTDSGLDISAKKATLRGKDNTHRMIGKVYESKKGLGPGWGPKPKSIWVWIQNLILHILVWKSKNFKIFGSKNVKKNIRKFLENFLKNFQKK